MRYLSISITLFVWSCLLSTLDAQMASNRSSIEDRRYALRQQISDYEDKLANERYHPKVRQYCPQSEFVNRNDIHSAHALGRGQAVAGTAIDISNSPQQTIAQHESELRRCEMELRRIDQAQRYRNPHAEPLVVWKRPPEKADGKICPGLAH